MIIDTRSATIELFLSLRYLVKSAKKKKKKNSKMKFCIVV